MLKDCITQLVLERNEGLCFVQTCHWEKQRNDNFYAFSTEHFEFCSRNKSGFDKGPNFLCALGHENDVVKADDIIIDDLWNVGNFRYI